MAILAAAADGPGRTDSPVDRRVLCDVKSFAMRRAALSAAVLIATLGLALWAEHRTDVTLPAPTGAFPVGRTLFDWTGGGRELLVWMWYPAKASAGAGFDSYIPAAIRQPPPNRNLFTLLTRDPARVHGHSFADAALSPRQHAYPVAIIRAGGSTEAVNYSTLAEDLASHGYVVVGFDAPYRTRLVVFPNGRVIAQARENNLELVSGDEVMRLAGKLLAESVADTAFVLDRLAQLDRDRTSRFAGRLDLGRVGIFGHSFGGATALEFCREDARCKAGIDIDGRPLGDVARTGLRKPFMFLLSDHTRETDPEARQIMADIRSIYERLPANERAYVVIRGANHFTFSDDGALRKSEVFRLLLRTFGRLGISGRTQLALTAGHVRDFFGKYLK